MRSLRNNKLKGFTLTELLIVLAIVGILILLALPNLMPLISKAKSTEAQLQLNHLFTLERSYYYLNSKYSDDFNEIGFEPEKTIDIGGKANYRIEIVQSSESVFSATATAVVDFDNDGIYNIWQIDQDKNLRELSKD